MSGDTGEVVRERRDDPDWTEPGATVGTVVAFDSRNIPVTYSVTDSEIAKLEEDYKVVPSDLSVKANYVICQKASAHLRGMRGDIEKRRKELKADALAWGKKVDSAAKDLTEKILKIEAPHAEAKRAYDNKVEIEKREKALAEEKRVDTITERIATIKALPLAHLSSTSDQVAVALKEVAEHSASASVWAEEFAEKAVTVCDATVQQLQGLHAMKLAQEETAATLAKMEEERLAREEEDRKRAEIARIENERRLQEERDKEAERLRVEREALEAQRVEQVRRQEEAAARQRVIDAENDRQRKEIAQQQAEAAERQRLIDEENERQRQEIARQQEEAAEQIEADRLKMIENSTPVSVQEVHAAFIEPVQEEKPSPVQVRVVHQDDLEQISNTECYRSAANALLSYIGDKPKTKAVMAAILTGIIPHVKFDSGE